jgi:NAD(P)-dependent dehydrogenase (short-subunit alcohol dehydrogenase family)
MDVRDLSGKTALVTGAASGIGRATSFAFAQRGANLVICDVDEAGLGTAEEEIRKRGREVLARRVDVSSAEEMQEFAAEVLQKVGAPDLLVNNAGVALGARFIDSTLEDWEWIVGINLWGVIYGCHFFVPAMIEGKRGGHVINVSSAAGYVASSTLTAYSTTKFGVLGLSEALREELEPFGIGVTAVCPGIINTPITESSRLRGIVAEPEIRQRMIDFYRRRGYGPERVAENILRAVQRDRTVAPISPEAWAMYYLKRFSPPALRWFGEVMRRRSLRGLSVDTGSAPKA